MKKLIAIPIILLAIPGCKPKNQALMPLSNNATWTYQAEPGLQDEVVDLKVTGRIAVGSQNGYKLYSTWGTTHLAWDKTSLITSRLGGTSYNPPLTLLANLAKDQEKTWTGTVTTAGKTEQATAIIKVEQNEIRVGTITFPATQSIINLEIGDQKQEILTWFVLGKGIVQQEQRKNDLLVNRITYLSGP